MKDCPICDGGGHLEGCDALEKAEDLADLLYSYPCDGCCPNGCKEDGLFEAQSDARRRINAAIKRLPKWTAGRSFASTYQIKSGRLVLVRRVERKP